MKQEMKLSAIVKNKIDLILKIIISGERVPRNFTANKCSVTQNI